jgi:putative copper export protein
VTILTRWVGLVALAALVGGSVMAVVVLPPDAAALHRRLARWSRICVVLLLVASAGELLLRARTMTGDGFAAALAVTPAVLTRTHFGTVWSMRAIALALLLLLAGGSSRAARTAACALALGIALTTSLVAHAADQGDLSLTALIDWLHVAAAGAWTGGLFCLAGLVLRDARGWPPACLAALLRRFSILAGWCLAVVVASGIYNACVQLGSPHALWTTTYGAILTAKVLLVLAVAGLGAANRFVVLPRLGAAGSAARPPAVRLGQYVTWEAGLALLVFGCTALLTESPRPCHPMAEGATKGLLRAGLQTPHLGRSQSFRLLRHKTLAECR